MADLAGFRARYPQFNTDPPYTDAIVEQHLDDAMCDFSRSKLSNSVCGQNIYDRIIYSLTAHTLTLWNMQANKGLIAGEGPMTSKSVGKVSVSYNRAVTTSTLDEYYGQTIYGQQYMALLEKYCVGIITAC